MQDYFDPKTGEIIGGEIGGEEASPQSAQAASFQTPRKNRMGLWIGIGCGLAAVIVIAVAVIALMGLISSPITKISAAAINTFKEKSQLQKDLDIYDMLRDGNAYVNLEAEYEDEVVSIGVTYDFSKKHKAVNLAVAGEFDDIDDVDVDFTAELDKDRLAVSLLPVSDELLVYYYAEKNKGDLIDLLEDAGVDIEDLNSALKDLYEINLNDSKKFSDVLGGVVKAVVEELKDIKIKKIGEKESFEINGQKRACTGYVMEITEDNIEDILDAVQKAVEREIEDGIENEDIKDTVFDLSDEMFDELEHELSIEEDIELSFYIYGKQLACVRAEQGHETAEIVFHGGDYPTQNVEVIMDGGYFDNDTVFEIKGETDNKVETIEVVSYDGTLFELEYNTKNGELYFESDEADVKFDAVVKRDKASLEIEIDDIEDVSIVFAIKDDGTVKSLNGDEFDLGDADEEDLYDLLKNIMDEYGDVLYFAF